MADLTPTFREGTVADSLADLVAAVQAVSDATRVPYVQSAYLPEGHIWAMGPAVTGHDRDVLVIPTGPAGDRVLAALRSLGRIPMRWEPTVEETARAMPALKFDWPTLSERPAAQPRAIDWLRYGSA